MIEAVCGKCGKVFQKNVSKEIETFANALRSNQRDICYSCALDEITRGSAPEEGDFNTARIISGEITEEGWEMMRRDFEAVEIGISFPD